MAYITTAVPKNIEWWGIAREGAAGTITLPTLTLPLNGGAPDDMANLLVDKGLRGDMGEDYNEILGTLIGQFSMAGNVYLDSIGYVLHNLFGDYQGIGAPGGTTVAMGTTTSSLPVGTTGAVTVTAGSIVAGPGLAYISSTAGGPAEIVPFSSSTATTVTLTGATRNIHSGTTTIATGQALGTVATTPIVAGVAITSITLSTGGSYSGPGYLMLTNATGTVSEILPVTSVASTTATLPAGTTPRYNWATSGSYVYVVAAPFTHFFALLNGTGTNAASVAGLSPTAQPPTHTITHFNGLPASAVSGAANPNYSGFRQYAYWCSSGLDVTADTNNLFQHATKGVSIIGADLIGPLTGPQTPSNTQSDASANPAWRFQVAIGSPIGGAGNMNNIEQAAISLQRGLAPKYALNNTQNPVTIMRLAMAASGSLQFLAQDESPLLFMLAGTQQQIQIGITPTYLPVGQVVQEGIVFNFQRAQFEAATLTDPDLMTYQVPFRALMNKTDVGASGARGMVTVTLTNGWPSY